MNIPPLGYLIGGLLLLKWAKRKRATRENLDAFVKDGVVHPIRGSEGYESDKAGESTGGKSRRTLAGWGRLEGGDATEKQVAYTKSLIAKEKTWQEQASTSEKLPHDVARWLGLTGYEGTREEQAEVGKSLLKLVNAWVNDLDPSKLSKKGASEAIEELKGYRGLTGAWLAAHTDKSPADIAKTVNKAARRKLLAVDVERTGRAHLTLPSELKRMEERRAKMRAQAK